MYVVPIFRWRSIQHRWSAENGASTWRLCVVGAGGLVPTDDQVEAKKDHGGDGEIRKPSSTTEIVGRRVE